MLVKVERRRGAQPKLKESHLVGDRLAHFFIRLLTSDLDTLPPTSALFLPGT